MKTRLLLPVLSVLVLVLGCDSANPVAPQGTILTLSANPPQLALGGVSTITVTGFKPDGNPLNPGTQIVLSLAGVGGGGGGGGGGNGDDDDDGNGQQSASSGGAALEQTTIEIGSDGTASTRLRAGDRTENVTISASTTTGAAQASVSVLVGEDPSTRLTVALTVPTNLSLNEEAEVVAVVRNPDGTLVGAGISVQFRASLGQIDPTADTNGQGEARAIYRATEPGDGEITASSGSSDEVTGAISVGVPGITLIVPSSINLNETVEVTAVLRNSDGTLAGAGNTVQFQATLGEIQGSARTNSQGEATVQYTANEVGEGLISARSGASEEVSESVSVGAPSLTLIANPERIFPTETSTITIIGRAADGSVLGGRPVVDLLATRGMVSPSRVELDSSGRATATFTAGNDSGDGSVQAFMAGLSEAASVTINVRDVPAVINLEASPSSVSRSVSGNQTVTLTATVLNMAGDPVSQITVLMSTTIGTLASTNTVLVTNSQGRAVDTLTVSENDLEGSPNATSITVTARAGGVTATETITIAN